MGAAAARSCGRRSRTCENHAPPTCCRARACASALGADWAPSGRRTSSASGRRPVEPTHLAGGQGAGDLRDGHRDPRPTRSLGRQIGRLARAARGCAGHPRPPRRSVQEPHQVGERDVQFVAIQRQPFYGTTKLMKAAGASAPSRSLSGACASINSSTPTCASRHGLEGPVADIADASGPARLRELESSTATRPREAAAVADDRQALDTPRSRARRSDPAAGRPHPAAGHLVDKAYFDAVAPARCTADADGLRDYYV